MVKCNCKDGVKINFEMSFRVLRVSLFRRIHFLNMLNDSLLSFGCKWGTGDEESLGEMSNGLFHTPYSNRCVFDR